MGNAKYTLTENEKRVIDGVSIPQYYNDHIVPNRKGFRPISAERPSGLCPFHSDTDPSLHFWKEKKIFKCFGCSTAGNVILMHQLIAKEEKRFMDSNAAMRELAEMYHIELALDEEGNIKSENVFDIARDMLDTKQYDVNPFDMKKITIAGFRTFNNQIKNNLSRNPYILGEAAVPLYSKLDLMLSSYLAEVKDSNGNN